MRRSRRRLAVSYGYRKAHTWAIHAFFCGQAHDAVPVGPCPGWVHFKISQPPQEPSARVQFGPYLGPTPMIGIVYTPPPSLMRPDESTQYDLRTATQHEAEDVAQLGLRIDNTNDRMEYLERRIKALEEALAVHADLLQHYRLAAGI